MIWASRIVPSVTLTIACVSPRLNRAEPCVRGSRPTSHEIGRTSVSPRPSGRLPSRIILRTTSSSILSSTRLSIIESTRASILRTQRTFRRLHVVRPNLIEERVDGGVSLLLADDRLQHHQLVMDLRFDLLVEAGVQLHDRHLFLHRHWAWSSSIIATISWMASCAFWIPSAITFSDNSLAPTSIMLMASFVPPTSMFRSLVLKLLVRGIDDELPHRPGPPGRPPRAPKRESC